MFISKTEKQNLLRRVAHLESLVNKLFDNINELNDKAFSHKKSIDEFVNNEIDRKARARKAAKKHYDAKKAQAAAATGTQE